MVRHDKVAFRYAKAAFDYVGSGAKSRELAKALKTFADVMGENAQLARALTSNLFTKEQRRPIIEDIAKKLGLNADTVKILLVLSEAKRFSSLASIAARVHELVLESEDIIPIEVQSSGELDKAESEKIEKRFSALLGKKVEATYVIEPSVLGGLKVTAAGRSYDGTLSGWLGTFQERLVGG